MITAGTASRRQKLAEFVIRHDSLIAQAKDGDTDAEKTLVEFARAEIGYSKNTVPIDILRTIYNAHDKQK